MLSAVSLIVLCTLGVYCNVEVWITIKSTQIEKVMERRGSMGVPVLLLKDRIIELNWRNAENQDDDWIGLMTTDVEDKIRKYSDVRLLIQTKQKEGKTMTKFRFPVKTFTTRDIERKCLGYYIVYGRAKDVLAKNCIKINPKWMEENYKELRARTMTEFMIPGTHGSGSYTEGYKGGGLIDKYTLCQDESIFNQLMYGIRYFDLRVMYYSKRTTSNEIAVYWMAHDKYDMPNILETVLKDVRKFMDMTSKEVVILDFHRFPYGFDEHKETKHEDLIAMIETHLGPYLSTHLYYNVKVRNLVESGKRVIIGYAEHDITRPNFLYPPVKHLWAETDEISNLHDHFVNKVCQREHWMLSEAAMAELTPTTSGVIFDTYGGLRQLADNVNGEVTKWFRDEWATSANIVATDFFLGNNIIEVAINSLKKKIN